MKYALPLILALLPLVAQARTFYSLEEALAHFYPESQIERTTHYLTKEQQAEVAKQSGVKKPNPIIYAYRILENEQLVATVYFDKHLVRTLPETLMIGITPKHTVGRVEVIVFKEPLDYIPRKRWYDQLLGQKLESEFRLKRNIDGVTGATLTARATVGAARRTLALHALLFPVK